MPLNTVPNNTRKCIVSAHTDNVMLNNIERYIRSAAKGHWQNQIALVLLYDGYYINYNVMESLDNYMTRLQKMLDNQVNKYYQGYNFHIYYGQIGKNGEFGYYLECDKMGEFV